MNKRLAIVPVFMSPVAIAIIGRTELSDLASGSAVGVVLGLAVLGLAWSRRCSPTG